MIGAPDFSTFHRSCTLSNWWGVHLERHIRLATGRTINLLL
jgi:hypothetical protein